MARPPHPRRPEGQKDSGFDPTHRVQRDTWLAHVEHLRRARVAAAGPEEARLRDLVLANERLLCGRQRTILD